MNVIVAQIIILTQVHANKIIIMQKPGKIKELRIEENHI